MLEKREPKYENSSKNIFKNGAKIHQKSFQNRCEKNDEKKRFENLSFFGKPAPGAMRVIPKGYHFKRILRKKTEKKAD